MLGDQIVQFDDTIEELSEFKVTGYGANEVLFINPGGIAVDSTPNFIFNGSTLELMDGVVVKFWDTGNDRFGTFFMKDNAALNFTNSAGSILFDSANNFTLDANGGTYDFKPQNAVLFTLKCDLGDDEVRFAVHPTNADNIIVLTTTTNKNKDHDHTAQPDPTWFINSATDPDSDNRQWLSFMHDKTDAQILTGFGNIIFSPASGLVDINAGLKSKITEVTTSTYSILTNDYHISVQYTDTGTQTTTLPAIGAGNHGQTYHIKDADYNASVNNITIDTTGGDTIEEAATMVMSGDGDCMTVVANNTTKNWEIQ